MAGMRDDSTSERTSRTSWADSGSEEISESFLLNNEDNNRRITEGESIETNGRDNDHERSVRFDFDVCREKGREQGRGQRGKRDVRIGFESAGDYDAEHNNGIIYPSIHKATANHCETALLLINFQNEFTSPGGKLHDDVKEVMESNGMLSKVPKVLSSARHGGALVIHSPMIAKEDAELDELDFDVYGEMDGLFMEKTWNADFEDECVPAADDIVLSNRKGFSAFEGTGLEDILERNSIHRVLLMGFLSNGSIEETARDMMDLCPEIEIYILKDGSAAKSKVIHFNATTVTLPYYGNCITCEEAEKLLSPENFTSDSTDDVPLSPFRLRILALCGARSNNDVTKLQLENLHITEENHDILYLEGPIEIDDGDPGVMGLVHGPFYSWFDTDEAKIGESLVEAVRRVLLFAKANGPFDGIYGFSSGGLVAALAAGILKDENLQKKLLGSDENSTEGAHGEGPAGSSSPVSGSSSLRNFLFRSLRLKAYNSVSKREFTGVSGAQRSSLLRSSSANGITPAPRKGISMHRKSNSLGNILAPQRGIGRATSRRTSMHRSSSSLGNILAPQRGIRRAPSRRTAMLHSRNIHGMSRAKSLRLLMRTNLDTTTPHTQSTGHLDSTDFLTEPFSFTILACSAFSVHDVKKLRELAGIPLPTDPYVGEEGNTNLIETNSFHLIGLEDDFKAKSEEIASLFKGGQIMYLPGGHSIGREERLDDELCSALKDFTRSLGNSPSSANIANFNRVSNVSSIALHPHKQVAEVMLDTQRLPEGIHAKKGGATILALFQAQPKNQPFLYDARNPSGIASTYGDVASFICGGDGDLRRLGVKSGEVVAYGAPPGGSAAAALAFLSIGAQTAAAPLAPGMTEPEALDALLQFDARHVILFEGVDCPGIEAAFLKYTSSYGKASIHRARIIGDDFPGMFEYIDPKVSLKKERPNEPLRNPANGTCLLLRTSGTTARPKGVPLEQGALVNNGAIIASSMGLQETDVCYSVMPLFHIGGISASILCTLASGGSVCCDGKPYDPGRMVDALVLSNPQPTWYSSVPTIHNATVSFMKDQAALDPKYKAYGIDSSGVWTKGHSLRMIRSGAATLLGPDGEALAAAYGGVPIYPTYSMSEQMPISQPPAGKADMLSDKPASVGVPVAASLAIVSRSTLRPQPHGAEGEIAISGPTVLKNYLDNPNADRKSYFFLTQKGDDAKPRYFLTGDVGLLDSDGFLSLKGRAKELIKKGGEQVSPFEVEEPLLDHPWVQIPVCFAVRSKLYGEEVGCALVLSPEAPLKVEKRRVVRAMRERLKEAKLAPIKWPTKWVICQDIDLPKTKTKKYIRIGLAKVLGLEGDDDEESLPPQKETKARIDWGAISGFRFCLACYVMFMHIGSNESWGAWNNLRGFPWHVHVFFTLGGFSLASPMNPAIKTKFSYFLARIGQMYPMYAAALVFGLVNLLVVCRPSTFRPNFHWNSQPDDLYLETGEVAPLFCEGTPATPDSYWASLGLTVVTYIFGLAVTPFWPINWWMGYYLWFSSMYYQCLAVFPALYNFLFRRVRKNTKLLLSMIVGLLVLNAGIIAAAWLTMRDGQGFHHYEEPDTARSDDPMEENIFAHRSDEIVVNPSLEAAEGQLLSPGELANIQVLSFYLLGPFWALYFVLGACTAFLYDAMRPAEKHSAYLWGWTADAITVIMMTLSVAHILQGSSSNSSNGSHELYMRPDEADQYYTDVAVVHRLWDNLNGRLVAPLTTLWVFSVSTGRGWTAWILGNEFLVDVLAPNSYNCFLFHQFVSQWYYAATRNGHWWNWWRYRKDFYWFSPGPCPVEWYEYFFVVGLVVLFSQLMEDRIMPISRLAFEVVHEFVVGPPDADEAEEEPIGDVLCQIVEKMTGIEAEHDHTLEECGLASVGIPVLVGLLNKRFSTNGKALGITAADMVGANAIADMAEIVETAQDLADDQGV